MHHSERNHRRRSFDDSSHAHALTFCCYQRHRFLSAERACEWLAAAIVEAKARRQFSLWGYVFMPEHAHLIVKPMQSDTRVPSILKSIKQPVGRRAMSYLDAKSSPLAGSHHSRPQWSDGAAVLATGRWL